MSDAPLVVEIEGVTKRFGDHAAVDDLSIRIPEGSTFGFIGPNGAGKTTTIRMLLGLLRPTAGRLRVLGRDVIEDGPALRQRVGYVPELHNIPRWMRVRDVIGFARSVFDSWNDQMCRDLLRLFELDEHKKVRNLSKGMVAKLALLLAVAHEPEVLILDEPTSGLDPLVREEFLDGVLRTICERERTVLFSSHTLSDVQRLADTVGILYNGKLLAYCPTDELLTGTKRVRAVLRDGAAPADPPDGTIWHEQRSREWLLTIRNCQASVVEDIRQRYPVDNVEIMDLGLEDVFKDFIRGQRATA